MQGGYEPRGSRGPGRGIYLVRRAVFIATVIILVAFVLPRACGILSDPGSTDSASNASRSGGGSGASAGGSSGGGSGSGTATSAESGTASSSPAETTSGEAAGGDDASSSSAEGSGDEPDADGEGAMPSTVEETIAVEEPEAAAPTGIPTRTLAEERDRRAQRKEDARARRLAPPMTPFIALPLLPERPDEPPPDRDERVRAASRSVSVERPAAAPTRGEAPVTQPAPDEPVADGVATATVVEPATRRAGGRVARAGNNVAYAAAGGVEDGGRPARTLADARSELTDITPARGGARAAVRGALGDAGSAVRVAESLGGEPTGESKNRCAKKPQRCAGALLR